MREIHDFNIKSNALENNILIIEKELIYIKLRIDCD